jgi:hypothetical protein
MTASTRLVVLGAVTLAAGFVPLRAAAQLRPLDPTDWRAFEPDRVVTVELGGDGLLHQPAPIAGMTGPLIEAPAAFITWNTGRIVLRAVVHPLRLFRQDEVWTAPIPGTTELTRGWAVDAGDNLLETLVRLTSAASAQGDGPLLALRYGVRLPTHNDRRGIDRHKTDFYALLGGRVARGGLSVGAEGGIGVFGSRQPGVDKVLPFAYALNVRWHRGPVEPSLALTGQTLPDPPRGNPDLSELRFAVRVGRTRWLEATYLRGLVAMSPSSGFMIMAGVAFPAALRR